MFLCTEHPGVGVVHTHTTSYNVPECPVCVLIEDLEARLKSSEEKVEDLEIKVDSLEIELSNDKAEINRLVSLLDD